MPTPTQTSHRKTSQQPPQQPLRPHLYTSCPATRASHPRAIRLLLRSVIVPKPAHLRRTVEVEQKAEAEVDGAVLDQLPGRVGKRLCFFERLDRLVVEKLEPGRLRQGDVAEPPV